MKDKTKIYSAFNSNKYEPPRKGSLPVFRFKRLKILYEDDISYYVASLTKKDGKGNPIHYSIKKHCYTLQQVPSKKLKEYAKWQRRIQRPDEKLNEFEDEFTKWGWIEGLKWFREKKNQLDQRSSLEILCKINTILNEEIGENDAD